MKDDITPSAQRPARPIAEPQGQSVPPVSNVQDSIKPEPPLASEQPQLSTGKNPKRWLKRIMIVVATLLVLLIVATVAVVAWYNSQLSAVNADDNTKQKVVISPGTDVEGIAAQLEAAGLIRSSDAFGWYVRLNGTANLLQSGTYRLSPAEDVPAIVRHLTSGKTDSFSITFLPGATLDQHRTVLIEAGYEASAVDAALGKQYDHPALATKPAGADLEGYIYGETYSFPTEATPEDIITRTFDQFQQVIEENDLVAKYKTQGFTLYEGITMASIIQREVVSAEDAAQVAQIFKLRYDQGMQLGSDVTYQYIADKLGQPRSVDFDSPYNTRRYTGLPPGPISSPGSTALLAVANPAPGDFVFFLSGDDDKTYYARTVEEHERNIREHCQKKCQII